MSQDRARSVGVKLHDQAPTGIEIARQYVGKVSLKGRLVHERKQTDHRATCETDRHLVEETIEYPPILLAQEQLLAVDDADERHRLAAERVDHMAIIDHMAMLAIAG